MPWGGRSVVKVTSSEPTRSVDQAARAGVARNQPAPGSLYAYADALNKPSVFRRQRQERVLVARPVRLRHDRPSLEKPATQSTVQFPIAARKVCRGHARPGRSRARGRSSVGQSFTARSGRTAKAEARSMFCSTHAPSLRLAAEPSLGGATVLNRRRAPVDETARRGCAAAARSVSSLGESRPGSNECVAPDARTRSGDVGPAGGFIFLRQPELRG
jgi:hypothetical protein